MAERRWRIYISLKERDKRLVQKQIDVKGANVSEAMDAVEEDDRFNFAASGISKESVTQVSFTIKELK